MKEGIDFFKQPFFKKLIEQYDLDLDDNAYDSLRYLLEKLKIDLKNFLKFSFWKNCGLTQKKKTEKKNSSIFSI